MITVSNIEKSFGQKQVLRDVSFAIEPGETLAIIGKSGSGKSVLLKLIVGLLAPDSGEVEIEGRRVDRLEREDLYEVRRRIGYVFQGAALFDSMSVWENLTIGLWEHGERDRDYLEREVVRRLRNVGLLPESEGEKFDRAWRILASKKPAELSGGMRKRVGVARALIGAPDYVFYDEPTTGLDPVTSKQIDDLVCDLATRLDVTSVVVTHDIFSVWNVADRVIMLHEGEIRFDGTTAELRESSDPVVREFIERYEPHDASPPGASPAGD